MDAAEAVRTGDVEALRELLAADPELARARPDGQRTLLHVATDWPGGLPRVAETIAVLAAAGADVDAPFAGGAHAETPLHWAASADDVAAVDALVAAGADVEAPGAVIGDGTPLADAVAFGQWRAAARLVGHGAVANLWQAAALGQADRVEALAASAARADLDNALWCAAHGGQRTTADLLLGLGADPWWVGHDGLTAPEAASRSGHEELAERLRRAPPARG